MYVILHLYVNYDNTNSFVYFEFTFLVEFVAFGTLALMVSVFLSILACIGYIDEIRSSSDR